MLGGFNLIEAENIDEAVRMAAEFPWAPDRTIEGASSAGYRNYVAAADEHQRSRCHLD